MKTWIIGNWKNNPASLDEATELMTAIKTEQNKFNFISLHQQHMVIPSSLHLSVVKTILNETDILLGSQDVSKKSATVGAFTGDCSAAQLLDVGAKWTLVGHSERREYYCEDQSILCQKIENSLSQGLKVIFCIGESLTEYEDQQTIEVLTRQLNILKSIKDFVINESKIRLSDVLIVAYEPIWAIGTGKVPTVDEVEAVHIAINHSLITINPDLKDVSIIYGGSVNPDNAEQFAKSKWIQGALIGGASLKADKFIAIARTFYETKVSK